MEKNPADHGSPLVRVQVLNLGVFVLGSMATARNNLRPRVECACIICHGDDSFLAYTNVASAGTASVWRTFFLYIPPDVMRFAGFLESPDVPR